MAESRAMASGRAEILRSRQLLRDGNAIRGTRPMCPSRAALVHLSPINSSEFPHDNKLILMRARLAFQSRFRRRSQSTDPVKRVASALLELSSKAGLASARKKGSASFSTESRPWQSPASRFPHTLPKDPSPVACCRRRRAQSGTAFRAGEPAAERSPNHPGGSLWGRRR